MGTIGNNLNLTTLKQLHSEFFTQEGKDQSTGMQIQGTNHIPWRITEEVRDQVIGITPPPTTHLPPRNLPTMAFRRQINLPMGIPQGPSPPPKGPGEGIGSPPPTQEDLTRTRITVMERLNRMLANPPPTSRGVFGQPGHDPTLDAIEDSLPFWEQDPWAITDPSRQPEIKHKAAMKRRPQYR